MQINMKYGELEEMTLCGAGALERMILIIAMNY